MIRQLTIAAAAVLMLGGLAAAGTYPRVYGPTGRLYGPTQAPYQYQRQYGNSWSGYRGIPGGNEIGAVNGYPRVLPGVGYSGGYYPGLGYYTGLGYFSTYPYGAYPYGYPISIYGYNSPYLWGY